MSTLKEDLRYIVARSIETVVPDRATAKALDHYTPSGKVFLLAIGKAAWKMANAAKKKFKESIDSGIVVTKYGHNFGEIPGLKIFEAGHPVPDENSLKATQAVLSALENERPNSILFLISGGGSALFEKPLEGVTLNGLITINEQLLKSGADIVEINTVRKHLSAVKGGRFARLASPARIHTLVLSDVLGDRLDSIASGPAYPDSSTSEEALRVVEKYGLKLNAETLRALKTETPDRLFNVQTEIIGSVSTVCQAASVYAKELGYTPMILTSTLNCQAREAGSVIASIAREELHDNPLERPCAIILGGETTVHVTGKGKGGRNQELALSFAIAAKGIPGIAFASVGTDGTDGPTDAAGGIVDGTSFDRMTEEGIDPHELLKDNDSYHALEASRELVKTGPTGTNVNDLIILLCK